jgi:hypothetical protein
VSDDVVQWRGGQPRPGDQDYVDDRDETGRRNYKWPSFTKDNLMSVTHGAGSRRIVSRLAGELAGWVTGEFPDLAEPRYRFSLASWARAESIVGLLTAYLDDVDVVEGGEPREKLLGQLRAAERRASEERSKLGLSPADHARLERQRVEAVAGVASLDGIRAAGRKALDAHRERLGTPARLGRDGEQESAS